MILNPLMDARSRTHKTTNHSRRQKPYTRKNRQITPRSAQGASSTFVPTKKQREMKAKFVLTIGVLFCSVAGAWAQTRVGVLKIAKGEFYEMKEDTLYAEQIILQDSAQLILHKGSKVSY